MVIGEITAGDEAALFAAQAVGTRKIQLTR